VAGGQVELLPVSLDDDVGMQLERVYQLFAGQHRPMIKDVPIALGADVLDQRQIVAELGAPALGRGPGEIGQPFAGLFAVPPGWRGWR
jgi:hypothetical protein